MGKELGFPLNNSVEPGPGPYWSVFQSLELAHGASNKMLVDAPGEEVQRWTADLAGLWVSWPRTAPTRLRSANVCWITSPVTRPVQSRGGQ